ncbi:MAG: ABC transporter permease [Acidimicrobiales bacterium]
MPTIIGGHVAGGHPPEGETRRLYRSACRRRSCRPCGRRRPASGRLAIIPLFLFSATFYPLDVYPGWLQVVVACTPLYQGVALLRSLDLGRFGWVLLGHAAYLGAMGVVGLWVTARRLAKLPIP